MFCGTGINDNAEYAVTSSWGSLRRCLQAPCNCWSELNTSISSRTTSTLSFQKHQGRFDLY